MWIKRAFHPPISTQRNHKLPTHYPNPIHSQFNFFPHLDYLVPEPVHTHHTTRHPSTTSLTQGQFFLVPTKTNPNQTPSSFSHKNKNITKIKLTSFLIFQRTSLNYLSYFVEIQHHPPLSKTSNQSL